MGSMDLIDLCNDDDIWESRRKDDRKELDSVFRTRQDKTGTVQQKCEIKSVPNLYEENRCPNGFSMRHSDSNFLEQGCSPVDESIPLSLSSVRPAPISRNFWKAGNYEIERGFKAPIKDGKNHLSIHPLFLHSNATSHKWAFGAIAELIDNAVDEIQNGATYVVIDKISNPRDGSPALLIQDDGGGMDPEAIRRCMSFGFSDKKINSTIGQYGNGFKTSSMRLGADVVVFTCHSTERTLTQSIGLLSYTFLRQTGHCRIVVPMVDYEFDAATGQLGPKIPHGETTFFYNLSILLEWSPYSTEETLLKQFDDVGQHGTKIVIYNLWLNDEGDTELDFNFDAEDIRINIDPKLIQTSRHSKQVGDQHIAKLYQCSLRVYSSILYLRLPQSFKIILRGQVVEHHNIANDLKFLEFILYRPQVGGTMEAAVVTTIGFLNEAPCVNIHGFNVYHRNRLILPFWRVVKDTTNSNARGVVGVLEANFIKPTHNKQDFEKTSIFQKLETRLREMTMEYWKLHCGLIGYQQVKKSPPPPMPSQEHLPVRASRRLNQPFILNHDFSEIYNQRPLSHKAGSFEANAVIPSHGLPRSQGKSIGDHDRRFRNGLNVKRKERNLAEEFKNAKRHTGSGSCATNTQQQNVVKQLLEEETMVILMQENGKLRSRLMELERTEREFNLKVQQLRNEVGDAKYKYTRLLGELESTDPIKVEKDVKMNDF